MLGKKIYIYQAIDELGPILDKGLEKVSKVDQARNRYAASSVLLHTLGPHFHRFPLTVAATPFPLFFSVSYSQLAVFALDFLTLINGTSIKINLATFRTTELTDQR